MLLFSYCSADEANVALLFRRGGEARVSGVFDELLVGDSWASVRPAASPVENSEPAARGLCGDSQLEGANASTV